MIKIRTKLIGQLPKFHDCWQYEVALTAPQYTEQLEINGQVYTLDQDARVYSGNLATFTHNQIGKKTVVVSMPTKDIQVVRDCICDADTHGTDCTCYSVVHGEYVFVES